MLELEHGFRVVDVHARLQPGEQSGPQARLGTPGRLEREMHQAGIVRAVVSPDDREGSYLKANNAVARMSVGRPFVPVARINGARDVGRGASAKLRNLTASRDAEHTAPDDIEQYAYDDRFVGFRLDPATDGLPDGAVFEQLDAVDLPVLVHAGEGFPPDMLAEHVLGHEFPTVVSHFGGYPLNRGYMHETIDFLGEFDNCYLDTSAVRFRNVLERAITEHPDRVCFGTGTPATHPNVAIMEILTLDIPEDAMRKVFSNNPGRVVAELSR